MTLELEDPAITLHILFGRARDPGDGHPAIGVRELNEILKTNPDPASFAALVTQDLSGIDFL